MHSSRRPTLRVGARDPLGGCPGLLWTARPEDGWLIDAVAVEVAGNGLVAGLAEVDGAVGRIDLAIAVAVNDPLAGAEDGNLLDAVAVEISDHGDVAFLAKLRGLVTVRPATVAVHVEVPLAVTEDADRTNAIAVPVAGDRDVIVAAELEDVVDQVGTFFP